MYDKISVIPQILSIINLDYFNKAVISNPIKKSCSNSTYNNTSNSTTSTPTKVELKKIIIKDSPALQITSHINNQAIHENIKLNNNNKIIINKIIELMLDNFKQCNILADKSFTLLMNKKRLFTISGIKNSVNINTTPSSHNKQKNYILKDGEYIEWLYKLNLIDKNGFVLSHMQKKFRQINKFLEFIKDIEDNLPDNATIIDMGCGKSYLTFAMYHYFNNIKHKNISIRGYDLKKQVVDDCNKLAQEFKFNNLMFYNENIENISNDPTISVNNINMIISLHACNTATDYALYFGVKYECDVILSVPCCQHEVFSQIKQSKDDDILNTMLSYGILKERFSSLLTDNLRADTLKLCGYKTNIIEFIDLEHTPKNIMIKAIKNNNNNTNNKKDLLKLEHTLDYFEINPTVYNLLKPYFKS